MATNTNRAFWGILSLIVCIAFAMRLITLDHGLPDLQIGDENSDLSTALRLTERELPQRHVRYHRSLIAYVNGAAVGGLFGREMLTGQVDGVPPFRDLYFSDNARFVVATRLMMALLTTLAVLWVGLAGRVLHPRVGLLAAAALTTNGFFLINSIFALPDGLVTFSVALFMWLAMRVWQHRRPRDYFAAGVALAVVMLSKFSAVSVGAALIPAHLSLVWDETRPQRGPFVRRLVLHPGVWWAALGLVVGNLLINPLGFIYPKDLFYEINRLSSYAYSGSPSLTQQIKTITEHLAAMSGYAWRWMIPASLMGVFAARRWKLSAPYWIIFTGFWALFFTIGRVLSNNYKVFFWTSWLIPMALLSGVGLEAWIGLGRQRRWQIGLAAVAVGLLALDGTFALHLMRLFERTDTRLQAQQYVESQITPGTPILIGSPIAYSVPLQRDETSIRRALALGAPELESWRWWLDQPADQRPGPAYNLFGPEYQRVTAGYDDLQQVIDENSIQFVIETDYCFGPTNPASDTAFDFPPVSDTQRQQWELVRVFSPFAAASCPDTIDDRTGLAPAHHVNRQQRTGPVVRIYRVVP
jgi:hypothetical protein